MNLTGKLKEGLLTTINICHDIYPNPTSGTIYITGLTRPVDARIFSIQGKLLKSDNLIDRRIDISDLPSGAYLGNIISGDKIVKKTIVKR